MNENWISVQHDTHYLSILKWTYYGLLQTSPSSICVQFIDFGLNSVTFCTITWYLASCLQMKPTSFIYLGLHGGIPFFLTLDDMATLVLCSLTARCQILISS